jgi:hypothetical protein
VVEHDLAKVGVEGSNPFARSRIFSGGKAMTETTSRLKAALLFWPRLRTSHSVKFSMPRPAAAFPDPDENAML